MSRHCLNSMLRKIGMIESEPAFAPTVDNASFDSFLKAPADATFFEATVGRQIEIFLPVVLETPCKTPKISVLDHLYRGCQCDSCARDNGDTHFGRTGQQFCILSPSCVGSWTLPFPFFCENIPVDGSLIAIDRCIYKY